MKKTLNINLGGLAFIINEDAFELLHRYLETLKAKFKDDGDRIEIMNDIEARMADLLNQKLAGKKEVLGVEDVEYVTGIMGKPEDIAGEEVNVTTDGSSESDAAGNAYTYTQTNAVPVNKRLFRDADDAKVGGVISGLCHYFGISDPVWARLAVVLLCFVSFGTVILLYLLLVIIIPKAITAAEKLQMKGEPVNINTIEREIRDAASRTSDSVNKLVNQPNLFERLLHYFVEVVKIVLKLIAGFIIVIGLFVLAVILLSFFGVAVAGNTMLSHAPHLLVDNPTTITIFNVGVALFIAAPLIALIYAALRAILGRNRGRAPWLKWTLLAAWWIGVFMIIYSVAQNVTNFRSTGTKHEQTAIMQPANGNILVQLTDTTGQKISADDDDEENDVNVNFNGIYIGGNRLEDIDKLDIGEPSLQLMPSQNDSFYVEKILSSQGESKTDGIKNTSFIGYNFSQTDTVVNLPARVYLDKNGKYRAQRVKIRIHIPEGKTVSFANNIDRWAATVKGDNSYDDTYFANTVWTVENGKVKCLKGENHYNEDESLNEKEDIIEEHVKQAKEELEEEGQKMKEDAEKHVKKIEKIIKKHGGKTEEWNHDEEKNTEAKQP